MGRGEKGMDKITMENRRRKGGHNDFEIWRKVGSLALVNIERRSDAFSREAGEAADNCFASVRDVPAALPAPKGHRFGVGHIQVKWGM